MLIAFALAFFFYYGVNTINDPVFSIDFLPYHMAGRLLAEGNLTPLTDYARTGSFGATSGPFLDYFHRYFFPDSPSATHWIYLPGYAWIFRPLAGLEFPVASRVWLAINASCRWAVSPCCGARVRGPATRIWPPGASPGSSSSG